MTRYTTPTTRRYTPRLQNRLKQLCRQRGMSIKELAEKCGRTLTTGSRWAIRERFPEPEDIVKICTVLECNVGDLFQVVDKPSEGSIQNG